MKHSPAYLALPLRTRLSLAATEYDAKLTAKDGNIYRLGIILRGLDLFEEEVNAGSSVARALYDNFNDRLLTLFEKTAGVPVTYGGGARSKGRPN
jgi:hypothetical protein